MKTCITTQIAVDVHVLLLTLTSVVMTRQEALGLMATSPVISPTS